MKTTEEMIAVMQAYADGETIQRQVSGGGIWTTGIGPDSPAWDWGYFDYRIKPAEPRKVMMQMWKRFSGMLRALPEGDLMSAPDWERIGEPFEFVFPEEVK